MTSTNRTCPECSGAHVHDLKFNHLTTCELGALDARQRLHDLNHGQLVGTSSFSRPPKEHEVGLLRAIGWTTPPPALIVTDYAEGTDAAGNPFHSVWIRGVKN